MIPFAVKTRYVYVSAFFTYIHIKFFTLIGPPITNVCEVQKNDEQRDRLKESIRRSKENRTWSETATVQYKEASGRQRISYGSIVRTILIITYYCSILVVVAERGCHLFVL